MGPDPRRRRLLSVVAGAVATTFAGCTGDDDGRTMGTSTTTDSPPDEASTSPAPDQGSATGTTAARPRWQTIELTAVRSEETFTIADLQGPVVVQSFAVWCPKCERQSERLAGLPDSITVLSLNTDPNEDGQKVAEHADSKGFDWRFAISPTEMTSSLIDAFGSGVTVAPSTPIIVSCADGTATYRSGSILSAEEIESIASDC